MFLIKISAMQCSTYKCVYCCLTLQQTDVNESYIHLLLNGGNFCTVLMFFVDQIITRNNSFVTLLELRGTYLHLSKNKISNLIPPFKSGTNRFIYFARKLFSFLFWLMHFEVMIVLS